MPAVRMTFLAGVVLVLAGGSPALAADEQPFAIDEATLRAAQAGTDGAGLLEFFRQRTLTDSERRHLQRLVRQLDDDDFDVRERATVALSDFGPPALPALRQAAKSPSLEVVRRAERCLKASEPEPGDVVAAAARLLADRRPAGAAEVLLGYLPDADDEQAAAEAQVALESLAFRDGRADPAVLKALDDPLPARRAAAAEVLCHRGKGRMTPRLRRLLKDPDAGVRLRTALLLADLREGDAIPVLLDSVAGPADLAAQADDYLRRLAGPQAPQATLGPSDASRRACRDAWAVWWRTADGQALLALIRKGTPNEHDREKTQALIDLLGDDDFAIREQATDDLIKLGTVAVPLLQKAVKDTDVEVARRAERCLAQIDQGPNPGVSATAIRVVSMRKPAGATAALLAYLPFAEEGPGIEEVEEALAALALPDGKPDRALVEALHDKLALRRGTAAVALCRASAGQSVPGLMTLLKDPDTGVRLRVAVAMAEQRQKEAVPALIGLLGELPPDRLWQAEDLLRRLAGEKAPGVALGTTESARRRCRDAWAAWWQKNADRVDMARLDAVQGDLGLTLVVCYDGYQGSGCVREFGPDRKTRWEITANLRGPIDAVMLPGNHVLIAEYNGFITERDTHGKVLWEHQVNGNNPISCQRLPNGNTFVATLTNLMEITPQGRQVYNRTGSQGQITCAQKLRNGHIVYIAMNGMLVELDVTGREIRSFNAANGPGGEWFSFTALPGGHYLVPRQSTGKVTEFDAAGKVVREVAAPQPYSAVRMPNGHVMAVSMNNSQITEVDRTGKAVWQEQLQGRPFKIRRR